MLLVCAALASGCVAPGNRPPQLVQWQEPVYPAAARAQGVEGYVEVRYRVGADGTVSGLQVVNAEPAGVFDAAALAAVGSWRYEPAIVGGAPIAVQAMTSRVTFTLGDGERYRDY